MDLGDRWLLKLSGLPLDAADLVEGRFESEAAGKVWEVLLRHALQLLKAGVRPSLVDYARLSNLERQVLVEANSLLAIDRAALIGQACGQDRAAAAMRAVFDGGEAHDDLLFDEWHEALSAALRKRSEQAFARPKKARP